MSSNDQASMPKLDTGIRDNHRRGTVGDFLTETVKPGCELTIVSAYFTIYAYAALKSTLESIGHLNFLFGEPTFVSRLDPEKNQSKAFLLQDSALHLSNRLKQKRAARECADWIRDKVEIRTIRQTNLLHGKMYHVDREGVEEAILGSSNFTVRGLGLGEQGNNIELNLIVNDNRDRRELKQWFLEIWNDPQLVKDVKADVISFLKRLYANQSPNLSTI